MRSSRRHLALATIAAALTAAAVGSAEVGNVDRYVAVNDVLVDDAVITGTIANLTGDRITEVRLIVSDRFLWANERSPGPDDPSRANVETLDLIVPPGSSVPFRIDRQPLPRRDDGRFVTDVRPIRVETLEVPAVPAVPAAAAPAL